jgi:hypothetical protein
MTGKSPAPSEEEKTFQQRVMTERENLRGTLRTAQDWHKRVLMQMLSENADTDFGRKHEFSAIRSLSDYRKAVPIRDYAGLEPWITRAANGESRVLTQEDPALFLMSSGTTGESKQIPVTRKYMSHAVFPFYFAMWAGLLESAPEVLARKDSTLNLKFDPRNDYRTTSSGKPHLGVSQVNIKGAFGENLMEPGTRAPWGKLPIDLPDDDHINRAYVRLRMASQHDLHCIIGFNPALVASVPRQLAMWWPRIVKEIHDGTINGQAIATPDPERARTLEQLATYFGTLLPSHVWPNMRTIYGWNAGVASLYMPRLAQSFGTRVNLLTAPIGASEGPIAVALDRHPTSGSLVVSAVVHEFLDADEDIQPHSDTMDFSQLEVGCEYHVIMSHVGGLYRYALGDVVRVIDFVDGVPRLEYAGRRTLSNAVGERLRESHITQALLTSLAQAGLEINNACCRVAPDEQAESRLYQVAIEPHIPFTAFETETLANAFDQALQKSASNYRQARRDGKLAAPKFYRTGKDAFFKEWQTRVASGIRPPQVKDRMFENDDAVWQRLLASADQ